MKSIYLLIAVIFFSCAGTRKHNNGKIDYNSFKLGVSVTLIESAKRDLNYNSFDGFYKTIYFDYCVKSLNIDEPSFKLGAAGAIYCIKNNTCFENPDASIDEFSLCVLERIKTQLQ